MGEPWSDVEALAYIASYPDLRQILGADPEAGRSHFANHGQAEGRAITFNAEDYMKRYPVLMAEQGFDAHKAVSHFIHHGAEAGHMMGDETCPICGCAEFMDGKILWPKLINDWQLSQHEVDYINRQQGYGCRSCKGNLRVMTLTDAVLSAFCNNTTLKTAISDGSFDHLRILDVNGAEAISDALSALPLYRRVDYPDFDLMDLALDSGTFDLVIHSDTLEHVQNPLKALEECRRVLRPSGWLCFTAPMIVERMTRSRAGLEESYHGDPKTSSDNLVVHHEFGADLWTLALRAGFTNVGLVQRQYPSGIAICAQNRNRVA